MIYKPKNNKTRLLFGVVVVVVAVGIGLMGWFIRTTTP